MNLNQSELLNALNQTIHPEGQQDTNISQIELEVCDQSKDSLRLDQKIAEVNTKIQTTYEDILSVIEKHCLTKMELDKIREELDTKGNK